MNQQTTMVMTLDGIFKTNFSIFDDYESSARLEQIEILNYIEMMARSLEKNLTDINLFKLFKNNNNVILSNKREIDNILLEFNREEFLTVPDEIYEVVTLTDDQLENISKLGLIDYESRLSKLKCDEQRALNESNSLLERSNIKLRDAIGYRNESSIMVKPDTSSIQKKINDLLMDSRFVFKNIDSTSICFIIRDDVIITHKNEAASIDLRVNLGKIGMSFKFSGGLKFKLFAEKDNIKANVYYHPHISCSGDLCTGNMRELFTEAMRDHNFLDIANIAMQVLTNYNDGDPYANILDFAHNSEQMQPNGASINSDDMVDRQQYQDCPNCGHEVSIDFSAINDYSEVECDDCGEYHEYEYTY